MSDSTMCGDVVSEDFIFIAVFLIGYKMHCLIVAPYASSPIGSTSSTVCASYFFYTIVYCTILVAIKPPSLPDESCRIIIILLRFVSLLVGVA